MFGFGFIMSVIFFSLSSVDFLPPPNRPLSMKLVLYRASAKKKQRDFYKQCLWLLPAQLWVSKGCTFWGLSQAEKNLWEPSTCHGSPSAPQVSYLPRLTALSFKSSGKHCQDSSLLCGSGETGAPASPVVQRLLNSYCVQVTRCSGMLHFTSPVCLLPQETPTPLWNKELKTNY